MDNSLIIHYFQNISLKSMTDEELQDVRLVCDEMGKKAHAVLAGRQVDEFQLRMKEIDSPMHDKLTNT